MIGVTDWKQSSDDTSVLAALAAAIQRIYVASHKLYKKIRSCAMPRIKEQIKL